MMTLVGNEAVIAWWRTMAGDLRFDCDLNALHDPLKNILSQTDMVRKVRKQTNSTIAIPRCALT
jgi:hypothetical protein